jgi:hypothetical protein
MMVRETSMVATQSNLAGNGIVNAIDMLTTGKCRRR